MEDGPQGQAHSLEMTATLLAYGMGINAKSMDPSMTLRMAYPEAYQPYMEQLGKGAFDMYVNTHLVAQSAKIKKLEIKYGDQQKGEPTLFIAHFDCDPGDNVRYHWGQHAANPSCELRLVSTQMPLFAS